MDEVYESVRKMEPGTTDGFFKGIALYIKHAIEFVLIVLWLTVIDKCQQLNK